MDHDNKRKGNYETWTNTVPLDNYYRVRLLFDPNSELRQGKYDSTEEAYKNEFYKMLQNGTADVCDIPEKSLSSFSARMSLAGGFPAHSRSSDHPAFCPVIHLVRPVIWMSGTVFPRLEVRSRFGSFALIYSACSVGCLTTSLLSPTPSVLLPPWFLLFFFVFLFSKLRASL